MEDWRDREEWPLYEEAVEEMLLRTSTRTCPWTLVEGNDKYWARVKVLERTVAVLSKKLKYKPARRVELPAPVIHARFRFYAELNDFLAPERRYCEFVHPLAASDTVKHVIESLGVPHTEVDLILVNGVSVPFTRQLQDGDRVSVYPMFESLDVRSLTRLRPEPLRDPRFVLDGHLGRLAAYLRMLGFDVWHQTCADDARLAEVSAAETRTLLTRDLDLLKRANVERGYFIRSGDPHTQLRDVVTRFDLGDSIRPFTRCMSCNGLLERVPKQAVEDRLPPHTRATKEEFSVCRACGKIYWKGSHHARMRTWIEALSQSPGSKT